MHTSSSKRFYSKIIHRHEDLADHVEGYNRGTKKRQIEDFSGLFCRAFYYRNNMVGGYAVNRTPPYFYFDILPDNVELDDFQREKKITEITGLWIKKSTSNWIRAIIYVYSVVDAVKTRPTYIIGGTFNVKLKTVQMRVLPRILFRGEIEVWGLRQIWWVYYATPTQSLLRLPYAATAGYWDRIKRQLTR